MFISTCDGAHFSVVVFSVVLCPYSINFIIEEHRLESTFHAGTTFYIDILRGIIVVSILIVLFLCVFTAMALLNAVPCYGLDGQLMVTTVIESLFSKWTPRLSCTFYADYILFHSLAF